MVEQKLGIASLQHQQNLNSNSKLIIEIGTHHISLLVKENNTNQAFELYELINETGDWDNIFPEINSQSKITRRKYLSTTVFLNTVESLIVPAEKFRNESIEPYLSAVYGNTENARCEADTINIATKPANIYRIAFKLENGIKAEFGTVTYKHTYTKILENLLSVDKMLMEMLKVQFYPKHMTVTVIYGNKLMLMQSYPYTSPEDVIYYLLNIVQEFSLNVNSTAVEVSGMMDIASRHFELLENVFGRLSLETIPSEGIFQEHLNVANAHFYTPFINLGL
ncbi:MAG: DUF3822 family protein [Chitinophagaceae bacterium]